MSRSDDPGVRWRRLERLVSGRIVRDAAPLCVEARLVLLAAVQVLAGGGDFPSRDELAIRLAIGRRPLKRAVSQLIELGLVRVEDRGSRPDAWDLNVELTESWAAGKLDLSAHSAPTSGAETVAQIDQNAPTNRPSPSLVPAEADRAQPPAHAREADLDRMEREAARALQDAGFGRISRYDREDLRAHLRAGVPLAHVEYAARECNRHGVRTLRYLETILDRLQDERAAAAMTGPRLFDLAGEDLASIRTHRTGA